MMQQHSAGLKAQVVDKVPKRFKELKFGIQSSQDIANQSHLEVSDRMLYGIDAERRPAQNGAVDTRLGVSNKISACQTCGEQLELCNGHFGHVRLALPAFHIGYFKLTMTILQEICKDCARVLLTDAERRSYLKQLRTPGIDNLKRTQICKKINADCRKVNNCPHCGGLNGQIRKINVLRLAHDKWIKWTKSTAASKVEPQSHVDFVKSFGAAHKNNPELEKHMKRTFEDLNPLKVLNLFKMITPADCELLGMNPAEGRPENFLWQFVPAPPVCIRPSVAQEAATNEDDLTAKLSEIVHMSSLIRSALQKGQPISTIMEQWEHMQVLIGMYVNSDVPGLTKTGFEAMKPIRGFCQRLKGKQGRFRGNLSGKRVDFSGRTVISPDPNLSIEQVAVPILVAKNMTYPERVTSYNLAKMQQLVRNGADKYPGANILIKKDSGLKMNLKFGNKDSQVKNLRIGDIVERHLEDNDVVLFNRQPSLHKLSIMSHYAKIRPWRTFRINECVCAPYNADFDGDEMNLHVPQTEEARTEAINLMGVKNNLCTPKGGQPLIAACQDFVTAAYLLSSKENFFDRKTFTTLCMYMTNATTHLDIPPPAILKPQALWTGKQVFSMMIRPNKKDPVLLNLDAKCRDFENVKGVFDMDASDGWLVIRNSEVMCGRMDKSTVGEGKKDSVFYVVLRDYGPNEAVTIMDRLAKLSARYLTNQGFSIGINDVYPSAALNAEKKTLIDAAIASCDKDISDYKTGKLEKSPGSSMEDTLEAKISGTLSAVRGAAGAYCIQSLSKWNSPLIMAKSGSKGSNINVAQMVALVGQQIIGGSRVEGGFQDRSLPHFLKKCIEPAAKGFVANSFFTGLTPTEFIFHAMSGREGLVDTAVKTAETGYMSRRLMKSLEDLSAQYDNTVRNSSGIVVQFQFGHDNLDPVDMEGAAVPVNFKRTWTHFESITYVNSDEGLRPFEIRARCKELLDKVRKKHPRKRLEDNSALPYHDQGENGRDVDSHEGARDFLITMDEFIEGLAKRLADAREKAGMSRADKEGEMGDHTARERAAFQTAETADRKKHMKLVGKVSKTTLDAFIKGCLYKYARAETEPGHAVGAVGAQSIGEPGTQMTLKTFHFAGVAGMNLTAGVPRIKEIINASKNISTPIIPCPLLNPTDKELASEVKGRIEKTYVRDVIDYIEDKWSIDKAVICISFNVKTMNSLYIEKTVGAIAEMIERDKKMKISANSVKIVGNQVFVYVTSGAGPIATGRNIGVKSAKLTSDDSNLLLRVNFLKRSIPNMAICGYPDCVRAVIQQKGNEYEVAVEGYGLRACMTTEGVNGAKCTSNSIMEVRDVLGIEAARSTIAKEIASVMDGMDIDPRHMALLADVMTYKGEVLGITRFGLSKMRDSVLQLASFEKTPDHLFDAAAGMKTDKIEGVSECIIMGQTMGVGTGAFKVIRELGLTGRDLDQKPTTFEDLWKEEKVARRKDRMPH